MNDISELGTYHAGIYFTPDALPVKFLSTFSQLMTPQNDQLPKEIKGNTSINVSSPKCTGSVSKTFNSSSFINNNIKIFQQLITQNQKRLVLHLYLVQCVLH